MTSRTQEEIAYDNLKVTMDNHFATGEILKVPEETLQKYLWSLCSEGIDNERVRHRAIVRALTINHIQMQKHIDKLNKQNNRLQWLVAILAAASLTTGGIQVYTTIKYSQQPPPHSKQQVGELRSPIDSNPSTFQPQIKDKRNETHK